MAVSVLAHGRCAGLGHQVSEPFRLRSEIEVQPHRIGVPDLTADRSLMRDLASEHGEKLHRRSTIEEMHWESTGRG